MYCCRCNNHLSECTCPDLKERLKALADCPMLDISPGAMAAYEEQAEKNLKSGEAIERSE